MARDGYHTALWRIKVLYDPDAMVNIRFTTDDLCQCCPAKHADGVCKDDNKVLRYDVGVIDLLDLEEGEYRYQDLGIQSWNL